MNRHETLPPSSSSVSVSSPQVPRRIGRATIVAIVGLIGVLAALYAFSAAREGRQRAALTANRRPPAAVSIEAVQPLLMSQRINAVGSLTAVHQVTVSSEVPGQITALPFVGGETIKKGDLLVQLNDASERADLVSFQAQHKQAELALKRALELQSRGNMADAQVDQIRSQFDVVSAGVERTRTIIAKKKIRAPFDGVLGVCNVEVGQYLAPGQPITSLTDLSNLYANISVPEQERPKISVGQPVTLSVDAYPGRTFDAQVAIIDPQINAETRTIRIQASVPNPDHALNPGMFSRASVVLPPVPDVLTLPETAVGSSLYGDFVFLVVAESKGGNDRLVAKRTQIVSGEHFDGRVAVVKGLNPGDRVVTIGLTKVNDGDEIAPSNLEAHGKSASPTP